MSNGCLTILPEWPMNLGLEHLQILQPSMISPSLRVQGSLASPSPHPTMLILLLVCHQEPLLTALGFVLSPLVPSSLLLPPCCCDSMPLGPYTMDHSLCLNSLTYSWAWSFSLSTFRVISSQYRVIFPKLQLIATTFKRFAIFIFLLSFMFTLLWVFFFFINTQTYMLLKLELHPKQILLTSFFLHVPPKILWCTEGPLGNSGTGNYNWEQPHCSEPLPFPRAHCWWSGALIQTASMSLGSSSDPRSFSSVLSIPMPRLSLTPVPPAPMLSLSQTKGSWKSFIITVNLQRCCWVHKEAGLLLHY